MAFIIGYMTKEERIELERRGLDVKDANSYDTMDEAPNKLMIRPPNDSQEAVVAFVDNSEPSASSEVALNDHEVLYIETFSDHSSRLSFARNNGELTNEVDVGPDALLRVIKALQKEHARLLCRHSEVAP